MNSSDAPARSRAYEGAPVVLALTVANVVVFLGELALERSASAIMMPKGTTMLAMGANYSPATLHEWRLETLVAACFLHFGIIHLGFNMVALKQLGPFLERAIGSGRFALLYLVTGIFGSATSAGWGPISYAIAERYEQLPPAWREMLAARLHGASAGASGAICGLVGAALVLGVRAQGARGPLARSMARSLAFIVVVGLFLGFDNAAHLGGAAMGALVAAFWKRHPETDRGRTARLAVVAGVLLLTAIRVTMVTTTSPFATLDADDRIKLAEKRAREGRCREAYAARDAALRIAPEAREEIERRVGLCP